MDQNQQNNQEKKNIVATIKGQINDEEVNKLRHAHFKEIRESMGG